MIFQLTVTVILSLCAFTMFLLLTSSFSFISAWLLSHLIYRDIGKTFDVILHADKIIPVADNHYTKFYQDGNSSTYYFYRNDFWSADPKYNYKRVGKCLLLGDAMTERQLVRYICKKRFGFIPKNDEEIMSIIGYDFSQGRSKKLFQ